MLAYRGKVFGNASCRTPDQSGAVRAGHHDVNNEVSPRKWLFQWPWGGIRIYGGKRRQAPPAGGIIGKFLARKIWLVPSWQSGLRRRHHCDNDLHVKGLGNCVHFRRIAVFSDFYRSTA